MATPKLKLLDNGYGTYIELDGKTMGKGINHIKYEKEARKPATLDIHISNLREFEFGEDGSFDEKLNRLQEMEQEVISGQEIAEAISKSIIRANTSKDESQPMIEIPELYKTIIKKSEGILRSTLIKEMITIGHTISHNCNHFTGKKGKIHKRKKDRSKKKNVHVNKYEKR